MINEQRIRNNKNVFITGNSKQARKLGELLATELRGGEIICLTGELGSGKTTFAQGVLKGLGVKGPHTSPTFVVMKRYKAKLLKRKSDKSSAKSKLGFSLPAAKQPEFLKAKLCSSSKPSFAYHIDAYRVGPKDILDLGWEEIIADRKNVIIVEWAERIKKIIPKSALWIKFGHRGKDKREIILS